MEAFQSWTAGNWRWFSLCMYLIPFRWPLTWHLPSLLILFKGLGRGDWEISRGKRRAWPCKMEGKFAMCSEQKQRVQTSVWWHQRNSHAALQDLPAVWSPRTKWRHGWNNFVHSYTLYYIHSYCCPFLSAHTIYYWVTTLVILLLQNPWWMTLDVMKMKR